MENNFLFIDKDGVERLKPINYVRCICGTTHATTAAIAFKEDYVMFEAIDGKQIKISLSKLEQITLIYPEIYAKRINVPA